MNKPVTLMLSIEQIESLKEEARRRSLEEKKDISYTDLIREAVGLLLADREVS